MSKERLINRAEVYSPDRRMGSRERYFGEKILQVGEGFGEMPKSAYEYIARGLPSKEDVGVESTILRMFGDAGFQMIRKQGGFDERNLNNMGIFAHDQRGCVMDVGELARRAEVNMPESVEFFNLLKTEFPVVVKMKDVNRGENKYLLRSREQKLKYMTWVLMGRSMWELYDHKNPMRAVRSAMINVDLGNYNFAGSDNWFINSFDYQRYISTPGDRYSSFRVLVDGFGKIHYSQVILSKRNKGKKRLISEVDLGRAKDIFEYVAIPGNNSTVLLTDPRSPFFLNAESIVSNAAQGGERVLLDGKKVRGSWKRRELRCLGINPDHPVLPKDMEEGSIRVGIENRGSFFVSGVDFMRSRKFRSWFLEANAQPGLNPEGLGMPKNTSWDEAMVELVRRVLK